MEINEIEVFMKIIEKSATATTDIKTTVLIPLVLMVFLGFFAVGIPLAALPNHVRVTLGFSNVWVGIVLGLQSLATLLTRHYSGIIADLKGPQTAVLRGIGLSVLSGVISFISLSFVSVSSLGLLLFSRVVLGLGESLLITGALAWGVGLLGPARAGRVMAWNGMAMYGAIAASAPLSLFLAHYFSFSSVIMPTIVLPAIAALFSILIPKVKASGNERMPFYKIINKVWMAGVGLSLSAVGFAGLAGFAVLYFKSNDWTNAPLIMTTFGCAFILARLFFGHVPDKYGGKKIALISLLLEALGQACVWLASSPIIAFIGAGLTGVGYSLTFPAFGVEAVKKVEPQFKGVALGAYVAFFDLALGITGPLAGLVANNFGYASVYLFGMICCLIASVVAWRI